MANPKHVQEKKPVAPLAPKKREQKSKADRDSDYARHPKFSKFKPGKETK